MKLADNEIRDITNKLDSSLRSEWHFYDLSFWTEQSGVKNPNIEIPVH